MRPEQNRKSLQITLVVINGYPRRKKRELYIKTRVVIAFMLSRKVRRRIDADVVSADICVYDPSGISDARKREEVNAICPVRRVLRPNAVRSGKKSTVVVSEKYG